MTDEFPAQIASNAEMFPFDDVIMAQEKNRISPFDLKSRICAHEQFKFSKCNVM